MAPNLSREASQPPSQDPRNAGGVPVDSKLDFSQTRADGAFAERLPTTNHLLSDNDPIIFFSGTIRPLLKQESLNSKTELERLCSNPAHRGQIIEALSAGAIVSIDESVERIRLVDILQDYWQSDYTGNPSLFVNVCNDIWRTHDRDLISLMGNVLQKLPLNPQDLPPLVDGFKKANVTAEDAEWTKPWVKISQELLSTDLIRDYASEIVARVRRGETTHYDHLLNFVCSNLSTQTSSVIENLFCPPLLIPELPLDATERISGPMLFLASTAASYLLCGTVSIAVFGIATLTNPFFHLFCSGSGLMMATILRGFAEMSDGERTNNPIYKNSAFGILCQKGYAALIEQGPNHAEAQRICKKMEHNSLFTDQRF